VIKCGVDQLRRSVQIFVVLNVPIPAKPSVAGLASVQILTWLETTNLVVRSEGRRDKRMIEIKITEFGIYLSGELRQGAKHEIRGARHKIRLTPYS
jgi:hypothetical protein